jgi:cytochrome c553
LDDVALSYALKPKTGLDGNFAPQKDRQGTGAAGCAECHEMKGRLAQVDAN